MYKKYYGNKYKIISKNDKELMDYFHKKCEENNILHYPDDCFEYINEMPERVEQITLF